MEVECRESGRLRFGLLAEVDGAVIGEAGGERCCELSGSGLMMSVSLVRLDDRARTGHQRRH